jgi:hypothetical protein
VAVIIAAVAFVLLLAQPVLQTMERTFPKARLRARRAAFCGWGSR